MVTVKTVHIDKYELPVMTIKLKDKTIISIPTQIGCPVKCTFCVSSQSPFIRNLTYLEMIELIGDSFDSNTLISFTGEGEPLLNLFHVNETIKHFSNDNNVSGFRVCTSGAAIDKLKYLQSTKPLHLQLSLHSSLQNVRDTLIPMSKPLPTLKRIVRRFRHMFDEVAANFVLMDGINDSEADLESMMEFIDKGWVIKLNPLLDESRYTKSNRIDHFENVLIGNGFNVKKFTKIGSMIDNKMYGDLSYKHQMIKAG